MMHAVYCQFVDYQTEALTELQGPFEFLQERYGEIIDEKGQVIACKIDNKWVVPNTSGRYSDWIITVGDNIPLFIPGWGL